ncbi:thermonuclease family protein [Mycobacterium sp. ITM-2016-00318]|uniref:thermonuclease family protein n=1 Tax=Mycobacterium sp. ITM-2016-00318 TaxID=2099693 RepID=UPI0026D7B241|nr:thermonuclease family protein [Mycobacterium sp. ITM-2016-00318]WNG95003.1 thermonuclease family protein [Mycobacterium sp. ITM-2016-00318]
MATAMLAGGGYAATPPISAEPVAGTAVVLKVVDGDTIDIRDDVRGRLRVRILGIDTPETVKPASPVECWGPEATEFAASTLIGQRFSLELDPTQDRTDRYGRTLAYIVRADGWDYSVEAARAGAARSYVYGGVPVSRHEAIAAAEAEARDGHRGLWGPPCNGITSPSSVSAAGAPPPPAPLLQPPAPPATGTAPPLASGVYYGDCGDARAAGDAPLGSGEPGYRSGLDRDGDGVACES